MLLILSASNSRLEVAENALAGQVHHQGTILAAWQASQTWLTF